MRPAGGDNSVPEQRPSGHTTCPQWVCVSSTVMGAYESCFRKQEGNKVLLYMSRMLLLLLLRSRFSRVRLCATP